MHFSKLFGAGKNLTQEAYALVTRDPAGAADIKANGLVHPIMLDVDGKILVDGRNRLKACEIAGVEPE